MGNYCVHCERCNKIIAVFHCDYPYINDDNGRLVCLECFAQIMDEKYKGGE